MMMKSQNNYENGKEGLKMESGQQDYLRKMFLGGLSGVTTEDTLRSFYSQWGDVVDVIVMRDPATKRSRGFGFITYSDPSMVDKAQASRPHVIDGKSVDSKRALPRPETGTSDANSSVKKIFVGGLKENHDEQTLSEHFSQFGNVVSVKILTDKVTSRKRGFAFVEFDDYDSVDKAVLHKNHTIKYVLVDVKKSVYKQELAKKLAAQQQQPQQGGMMQPNGMAQPVQPGAYQQAGAYGAQGPYGYPPQAPTPAYNGWGGYMQPPAPAYQQPPPAAPAPGYGAYAAPPQNGAAAAWNSTAYPGWGQNGYAAAAPAPMAAAPTAAAPPASANGWNTTAAPQNFGDYQQTYNGGPQKAGSLQGNRMNPYSVSAAPNYGSVAPGYVNMYGGSPNEYCTTTNNLSQSSTKYETGPTGSKKIKRDYN